MIIGENTQIEGSLEIWTSATISSAGVGSFQSLEVSPTGLRFPNDAFGGSGDTAGIRLVTRGTENQSLEIYATNDTNGDWVNLVVPSVNDAKVNGNTIWNAGNFDPSSKSDVGHTHSILNITDRVSQYVDDNYDVGTAKYLRWKNYGDGHEIIDASQGLSPTGSTISNTNPDNPWAPSYPTLMGWNGSQTYGVRVDRSRYSDNADALEGVDSSRFVFGDNGSATTKISGLFGDIAKSGFYNNDSSNDSPVPNTWTHLIHSDYTANDSWAWQIAANFEAANSEEYYTRIKAGNAWKAWRKIWTTKDISQTNVDNWNSTYSSVNFTSANWNTAYNKVITSRIAEGVYNANDSLTMAQRNSFGVSFGRIFSSTTATDTPELNHYFSYVLMPETPGANSQTSLAISNTNHSSYVGRGGWNSVMDWDRIWTDYDFSQININNWNTAYSSLGNYLPLSGGTLTGDLQILAGSTGWGEGIRVVAPAGSWGGLRLTRANDTVSRDGNWAIGYASNSTGDLEFHNYYNGNQHIRAKFLNAGGVDISETLTANKLITTDDGNGENIRVGNDAWIGDVNVANTIWIKGVQTPSYGFIGFGSDSTSLGFNGASLSYGGRFDVTQLRAGASTFCVIASTTNTDIWNDQGGSYSVHISNGQGFNFYQGTPGAGSPIAGINSNGTINSQSLTTSRVVVSDTSKNLISSNITTTELGYLAGTSANIQTQLSTLSASKADKTVTITAGTGLAGGGNLSTNRTISLATTGTAGTYTKVTTNAYGQVTAGTTLTSADVPTLGPSKISQDASNRFVTDTEKANWNIGYTSAHNHPNKANLDLINQSLALSASPIFDSIHLSANGSGDNIRVGNDAWIGDVNVANTIWIKGAQTPSHGFIGFGSDSNSFGYDGATLVYTGTAKIAIVSATSVSAITSNARTFQITEQALTTYPSALPPYSISQTMGTNDQWRIYGEGGSNAGAMFIETGDDGTESINLAFRQSSTRNTAYTFNPTTLSAPAVTATFNSVSASTLTIGNISNTEFNYLDGVTSGIQAQLNAKSSTGHTHQFIVGDRVSPNSSATQSSWFGDGLYMSRVYGQDYPALYGNILSLDGTGRNQIFLSWAGTDAGSERMWFRNKRDIFNGWSPWQRAIDTVTDSSSIANWNSAYTSAHFHTNKSNLDTINQNLSTTSQVIFSDITTTAAIYSRYGYFGTHVGWVDSTYALRVYGDSLFNGNASFSSGKQLSVTKDVDPSVGNDPWTETPILINRASTNSLDFSNVAGIAFHNGGVNAALFYYDPATSQFKYRRNGGGTTQTFWDSGNFNPNAYALSGHSHNVVDLSWTTNRQDGILNYVKNGITDSPAADDGMFAGWAYHFKMIHSANPNDWQFLLGVDFFTDSIGFRRKASGSWQAPQYLWHTGNFSQTNINNWNTAYTNNHTHTNKANLDSINQDLGNGSTPTFYQLYINNNGPGEGIRIGDDAWIGDVNVANTLWVKGVQTPSHGFIGFGSDSTSLGYNGVSLSYGGRFDVTQLRAGASTLCVAASTTNADIWNDQGGSYAIHISNGQGFNFYQGTPGAGSPIAGINSNGTINSQSLTTSRVVVSDTSKNLISSNITTTELGHLAGTSANIQTQINQLASASISGVGAGTVNRVSKFTTGTGIGNSNINDDGSTISFLTHITGSTAAFTGGLNVGTDGIRFPDNAFGGGGDFAWIRLISKGGEAQSMELYVGNDIDDWVNLVGPDNNFAKVNGNTIWNAGNLTQANINNWNTAYTSAHFHNNRTQLDTINQNLSTTSQVMFADLTTTAATYARYGYFGTHSGWVDGTYALRVYGDTLLGHTSLVTNYQFNVTKNITPTTASNTNYAKAPIVINRATQDSSTTTVAGIGFHNAGVNAATLYYDAVTSVFKYNREVAGPLVTIWDDSNFTPGNYLPKSGSFGGSDGYIFEIESGSDSGGLSLRLTDNSDGTEYFVVRNNAGDPSLIANSDRTVNIGYQNYQQVKPILSIGDQQYGLGANSGYLNLYSSGGGFRAFSKSGSNDAVYLGDFWHSGNFNPSSKSDAGHTHSILNITDRVSQYVDDNYDVGTAKYLRWNNYGDNHEIIDASQGLSPTGSTISNGNSDMPWAPTYPTLMGWNGVNTYGVRVDRSRYSDNADALEGHAASYFATSGHSHDIKDLAWTTLRYDDILNHVKNGITDSPTGGDGMFAGWAYHLKMIHSNDPNGWQFLLAADFYSNSIGFRRKQGGSWQTPSYLWHTGNLVNPVTGTGSTNYIPKFTGSTSVGNSSLLDETTLLTYGNNTGNTTFKMNAGSGATSYFQMCVGGSEKFGINNVSDVTYFNKNETQFMRVDSGSVFPFFPNSLKINSNGDRVVVTDVNQKLTASTISTSVLEHLTGVSSNIQTQINGKVNIGDCLPLSGGTMTGNIVFSDADEGVEFRRGAKVGNIGSYLTFRMEQDNNNPRLLSNNGATSWTVLTTRNVTTTTNYIPRFVGTGGLNEIQMQNSLISDDGTTLSISESVLSAPLVSATFKKILCDEIDLNGGYTKLTTDVCVWERIAGGPSYAQERIDIVNNNSGAYSGAIGIDFYYSGNQTSVTIGQKASCCYDVFSVGANLSSMLTGPLSITGPLTLQNSVTYKKTTYDTTNTIGSDVILAEIQNTGSAITLTLPSPAEGKELYVISMDSIGSPNPHRIVPSSGCTLRIVNSSDTNSIITPSSPLIITGRGLHLIAVSSTEWIRIQ